MPIYWERWVDPLLKATQNPPGTGFSVGASDIASDNPSEYEEQERNSNNPQVKNVDFISTPVGLIGVSDDMMVQSKYSLFIGRTTFVITSSIIEKINEVHGVEILKAVTRYAFLLGVGPQFNQKDVRKAVENTIDPQPADRLTLLNQLASSKYKNYAIMEGPDKTYECCGGSSHDEVKEKMKKLGELWSAVYYV